MHKFLGIAQHDAFIMEYNKDDIFDIHLHKQPHCCAPTPPQEMLQPSGPATLGNRSDAPTVY